jgi:hypothetical protein
MESNMSIVLATMLNAIVPSFNVSEISKLTHKYRQKQDVAALEYARNHSNTYILFLFPMAGQKDDQGVREIAQAYGKIIHSKKFYLSEKAAVNFFKLIYKGHGRHKGEWLGTRENNFMGAHLAVKERFPDTQIPLRVYLFECDSLFTLQKCKFKLRKYLRLGRESIHANDTHEETMKIAKVLFGDHAEDTLEQWNRFSI